MNNLNNPPTPIEPFSKREWLLLAALTLLGLIFRFFKLGQESIWFDEALSIFFARQPFYLSIQQMLEEGSPHTPFYSLLLRPFVWLNPSEAGARSLSALLGIATIPLIAQLGRVIFSRRVGIYAAILLTINPLHLWYSRETRMYALMALVSTAAMYFFSLCLARRPGFGKWLGLLLALGIGIYTHHFAYFIILSQFVRFRTPVPGTIGVLGALLSGIALTVPHPEFAPLATLLLAVSAIGAIVTRPLLATIFTSHATSGRYRRGLTSVSFEY